MAEIVPLSTSLVQEVFDEVGHNPSHQLYQPAPLFQWRTS